MTGDPVDPLDQSFASLIATGDSSVRLRNCVRQNQAIQILTVREFLSDPARARNLLLETPSAGRKTADELSALAETVAAETCSRPTFSAKISDERAGLAALISLIAPIQFPAALFLLEVSTRLRNSLRAIEVLSKAGKTDNFDYSNLGTILANWTGFCCYFLKQANVGRNTLHELESILEQIIRAKLQIKTSIDNAQFNLSIGEITKRGLNEALRQKVFDAGNFLEAAPDAHRIAILLDEAGQDPLLSPQEHIDAILAKLPQKENDTIVRRYGLGIREPETLEQIGAQFHVTRERVRQVEAKALGRLRSGTNRFPFECLIEAQSEVVWDLLSGGSDLILPSDIQDRMSLISRHFVLAVEVIQGRFLEWINSRGHVALGGWLRWSVDIQTIKGRLMAITAWANSAPGPVPADLLSQAIGTNEMELAIASRVRTDVRFFEGYVVPGHFGSQARRTCRLHRLALQGGGYKPFDICDLQSSYARDYPDDDISPRVVSLQLQRAPHLFFRLFDSIWISIGSTYQLPDGGYLREVPFARTPMVVAMNFEPDTIGRWLFDRLGRNGPTRLVDLSAQAETELYQKIAQSSVGAVLQSNPDFVRVAPGAYGLQRDVMSWTDGLDGTATTLLRDSQCRYYAISKKAGDPINIYPAWGFHFEMALCKWAKNNASADNYRSLLAVAEPHRWPTDPEEIALWEDLKRIYGSYRFPPQPFPQEMRLPAASDFLSSAIYMFMTGSIGWTTVNRASQRRVDSLKAATTIALLVRFGFASPEDHWQSRHKTAGNASELLAKVLADLSRTGILSWDTGMLHSLRMKTSDNNEVQYGSNALPEILEGGDVSAEKGGMMGEINPPDLDSLFSSDDWGSAFK